MLSQRRNQVIFVWLTLVAIACAGRPDETRQQLLARTTGTVIGTVVDAQSGTPLSGVDVSAQYLGDFTNHDGVYEITYLRPGDDSVLVWRRDIVEKTVPVKILAGEYTTLNIVVEKSRPACCRLNGTWSISMTADSPSQPSDSASEPVLGSISFSESTPDPFPNRRHHTADETLDEFGLYEIDLNQLFGYDYLSEWISNWLCANSEGCDVLREVEGYVSNYDQVEIMLIPKIADFGLGLSGTIRGNTIQGEWRERAFAGGARGDFLMKRELD